MKDELEKKLEHLSDWGSLFDHKKVAQEILDLIVERLPKFRDNTDTKEHLPEYDDHISVGYNQCLSEVILLLKGEK